MAKPATSGWTIVVHKGIPHKPGQIDGFYVGVSSEQEAKSKVQENYPDDPIEMTAAKLSDNSLSYLRLEQDDVRSVHEFDT